MPKTAIAPPMVDDPQILVPFVGARKRLKFRRTAARLDAIYVPCNRSEHIKRLLVELDHYTGLIYLLPSQETKTHSTCGASRRNIQVLRVEDSKFHVLYSSLATSNHRHMRPYRQTWDLPMKRNFVVQHALKMNYKRILIVDDDIRSIDAKRIIAGTQCLVDHVMAGCFVDDFVDTSMLGHLERAAGDPVYPFLSGSFLFFRPHDIKGFFPCIYNEDWLFMLPHILDHTICSFGSVRQIKYNPFRDTSRSVFQEFGDLLADGLYALLANDQYQCRYQQAMWKGIIIQRQEFLRSLSTYLPEAKYQRIIRTMLDVGSCITPEDCIQFVHDWENDILSWRKYIGEFK